MCALIKIKFSNGNRKISVEANYSYKIQHKELECKNIFQNAACPLLYLGAKDDKRLNFSEKVKN